MTIRIDGDARNLEGALKKSTGLLGGFGHALGLPGKALGGLFDGLGRLGLAGLGIQTAFAGISGAVNGLIGDAMEAQQVLAQTNAVIASTKGVAGVSTEAVLGYADSLSKVTSFGDEAIQSGENLLLTFTGIGKDVFPAATEAMLNMSQALGQDLQSSATQLGKSLQDPIRGVTALRRVGVALTDAQLEQIRVLQESGDLMGAQKVILKELATEFGGAAKAAGQTFAGRLAQANTAIGNVKEAIGNALLPALTSLITTVTPLISTFATAFPAALDAFGATIGRITAPVRAFLDFLSPVNKVDLMRAWFGPDIGPRLDDLVRSIKPLASYLVNIAGIIGNVATGGLSFARALEAIGANAKLAFRWVGEIAGQLGGLAVELGRGLIAQIAEIKWGDIGRALLDGVLGAFSFLANAAIDYEVFLVKLYGGLISTAVTFIGGLDWPEIGRTIMTALGTAWDLVKDVGAALVKRLGSIVTDVQTWVGDQFAQVDFGAIWSGAVNLGASLVNGLGSIVSDVQAWVGEQFSGIDFASIWSGATNLGASLLSGLGSIVSDVQAWVGEQFAGIHWDAIWGRIANVANGIGTALSAAGDVVASVASWLGDQVALVQWTAIWQRAKDVGTGLVSGLGDVSTFIGDWIANNWNAVNWSAVFGGVDAQGFTDAFSAWAAQSLTSEGWIGKLNTLLTDLPAQLDTDAIGASFATAIEAMLIAGVLGIKPENVSGSIEENMTESFIVALANIPARVQGAINEVVLGILGSIATHLITDAGTAMAGAGAGIVKWLNDTAASVPPSAAAIGKGIIDGIVTGVAGLPAALAGLWTTISTWIGTTAGSILRDAATFGSNIGLAITTGAANVITEIGKIWTTISAWIGETAASALTSATSIGSSLGDGISAGISNTIESVRKKAGELAEAAKSAVLSIIPHGSPSPAFIPIGMSIGEGLGLGIDQSVRGATASAVELADSVWNGIKKTVTDVDIGATLQTLMRTGDRGVVWDDIREMFDDPNKQNYFKGILDDGDYLNDWLAHLPVQLRPHILELGKVFAAGLEQIGPIFHSTGAGASNALMAGLNIEKLVPTVAAAGAATSNALLAGLNIANLVPTVGAAGAAATNALLVGLDLQNLVPTIGAAGQTMADDLMRTVSHPTNPDMVRATWQQIAAGIPMSLKDQEYETQLRVNRLAYIGSHPSTGATAGTGLAKTPGDDMTWTARNPTISGDAIAAINKTLVEQLSDAGKAAGTGQIESLVGAVGEATTRLAPDLAADGTAMGDALIGGLTGAMSSGQSSVVNAIVSVVTAAIKAANAELGVASPSRVFAQIGQQVTIGLANGIVSRIGAAEQAITRVSDAIVGQAFTTADAYTSPARQDATARRPNQPVQNIRNQTFIQNIQTNEYRSAVADWRHMQALAKT